jgi:hypothetical protein
LTYGNSKSQIPNIKQTPMTKIPNFQTKKHFFKAVWNLMLEIWNLFGIWCLEFGIYQFGFHRLFSGKAG